MMRNQSHPPWSGTCSFSSATMELMVSTGVSMLSLKYQWRRPNGIDGLCAYDIPTQCPRTSSPAADPPTRHMAPTTRLPKVQSYRWWVCVCVYLLSVCLSAWAGGVGKCCKSTVDRVGLMDTCDLKCDWGHGSTGGGGKGDENSPIHVQCP